MSILVVASEREMYSATFTADGFPSSDKVAYFQNKSFLLKGNYLKRVEKLYRTDYEYVCPFETSSNCYLTLGLSLL